MSHTQGSYAQCITIAQDAVSKVPEGMDHAVAASAATSCLAALQALRDLARVKVRGLLFTLVHGIASHIPANSFVLDSLSDHGNKHSPTKA
jgi:NADPH:quinone reductase-like Zn-dependent oxidoreductase